MGDISRHRDIFFNTRQAVPQSLLAKAKLSRGDLTFLEMGNYLTDVSQFRDPVTYIFAKQRIWREKILPEIDEGSKVVRGALALLANAGAAALVATGKQDKALFALLGIPLAGLFPNDLIADLAGLDNWIDKMFGKPIDRTAAVGTKRPDKAYGFVGQFFQHFIEGITHLLFASNIANKVPGQWNPIDRVADDQIESVFKEFFSQYYPHEHTDQPPYVWDASERPQYPTWYGRSERQDGLTRKGGIMNAVDKHYIQYLSEGLSKLEEEGRKLKPEDDGARRRWLVRMGKILHGVEDWYFHSNIVELIRLHSHKPPRREGEDDEQFLRRFVKESLPEATPSERTRLQRKLYRRLRFPVYEKGTRTSSAGRPSKKKSTLSLDHAYPAFPSQQDTAHTLLAALENLEGKAKPKLGEKPLPDEPPPWARCLFRKFIAEGKHAEDLFKKVGKARGLDVGDSRTLAAKVAALGDDAFSVLFIDVMREWLPLVATLLNESERQRLVANISPLQWQGRYPTAEIGGQGSEELDAQMDRHKKALETRTSAQGAAENNYQRAARYLRECGFINTRGEQALARAFAIDRESEDTSRFAPGAGGFLMQFAVELQQTLDGGAAATEELSKKPAALFDEATDNGAFTEIIGSHSLMSKDTLASSPFFDDAKVMASVASQSVFRIMLEEISTPADGKGVAWPKILQHFIRFPVENGGWERRAMILFRDNGGQIPTFDELPELARLGQAARVPVAGLAFLRQGTKATTLEEEYIKLERKVSKYRHP